MLMGLCFGFLRGRSKSLQRAGLSPTAPGDRPVVDSLTPSSDACVAYCDPIVLHFDTEMFS